METEKFYLSKLEWLSPILVRGLRLLASVEALGQDYSFSQTMILQALLLRGVGGDVQSATQRAAWYMASAAPARLAPDALDGDWLKWTVDADKYDAYMLDKAAELGMDPLQMFAYVRGLGYESYKGSLRGTLGGRAVTGLAYIDLA